jgi:inorganic triphosphatase YgiF
MTEQRLQELELKHKYSQDVQELIAEVRRLTLITPQKVSKAEQRLQELLCKAPDEAWKSGT